MCLLSLFLLFLSCSLSSFHSLFFLRAFCPFLSLHVSSSHVQLLSLCLFVLSDVSSVCVYSFFLTLFIPFFKTFFSNSFVSSFFFCFFNLVLSNKDLSLFYEKRSEDFELLRKNFFLFYLQKIATEIAGATNNFVQISFVVTSTCFEQVSRCQAFSDKFLKIHLLLVFFVAKKILNNLLVKKCFFEKNFCLSPFDFLHYLHCFFFLEREGGGKSCQFSIVKKFFVMFFNMFFIARNSPFSSFHFLLSFSCRFFSLGHGDQMANDKTRHQDKRVKPMVGMVAKV